MDVYSFWGVENIDYKARAEQTVEMIDGALEKHNLPNEVWNKVRKEVMIEMITHIRKEGTKESRLEADALEEECRLIYPDLVGLPA